MKTSLSGRNETSSVLREVLQALIERESARRLAGGGTEPGLDEIPRQRTLRVILRGCRRSAQSGFSSAYDRGSTVWPDAGSLAVLPENAWCSRGCRSLELRLSEPLVPPRLVRAGKAAFYVEASRYCKQEPPPARLPDGLAALRPEP